MELKPSGKEEAAAKAILEVVCVVCKLEYYACMLSLSGALVSWLDEGKLYLARGLLKIRVYPDKYSLSDATLQPYSTSDHR